MNLQKAHGAITKYWEVESEQPQITDVKGCLRKNLLYWKEVLHPPTYFQENHKSAISHCPFVNEAIKGLLSNRCAMRVEKPHVCSPLSVVSKSTGNLHLVLNLQYLNQFLHVASFKYEDLRIAALMFEANDFLFKFDLKSGNHHVDIHLEYFKYLGFQWAVKGVTSYYVFTVLPLPAIYLLS